MPRLNRLLTAALLAPATLIGPPVAAKAADAATLYHAEARWHAANDRPARALALLRSREAATGTLAARQFLHLGLFAAARDALPAKSGNDAARQDVHLSLAAARLRRGDAEGAAGVLAAMSPPADERRRLQHASLTARAALRRSEPFEAMRALALAREDLTLSRIDRYNLALAQLGLGDVDDGAEILETLGNYDGDDAARRALADRANLVLGYWLLDHQRPAAARKRFVRVRLDRPAGRRGLLGLGWSELNALDLPQVVTSMDPRSCDPQQQDDMWVDDTARRDEPRWECRTRDYAQDRELLDFVRLRMGNATQYERTVIAWRAAADGDVTDPAVAEAVAVLPYALAAAGDRGGAVEAFRTAVERLQRARERLAEAPAETRPADGSPLAHVADDLAETDPLAVGTRREVATLSEPSPAARNARERIGGILRQLRPAGSPGPLAAPGPVERARLRQALDTLSAQAATRHDAAEKAHALHDRLDALRSRQAELQDAIASRARQDAIDERQARHDRLAAYLRQVRRGLAALGSP